jgi:hypothetical protein
MTDERYKQIMSDLGMPNSSSLLTALLQVANEAGQAAQAAERERQRDKIEAHIGRSVMSVYGTQPECKAARDALQRLLDDAL